MTIPVTVAIVLSIIALVCAVGEAANKVPGWVAPVVLALLALIQALGK